MAEVTANTKVENGHYLVGQFTILKAGPNHWQVRDHCDYVIEHYKTLRQAKAFALNLDRFS